jgi:Zn-dependent peptidase ImmA (M78 family)
VTKLSLNFDWLPSADNSPEIEQTMGMFSLQAGEVNLTENKDIWSQKTEPTVFVSAYPLASWMASSWWRLLFEPLPATSKRKPKPPSVDWRMAHELTASNQGFIWPRVIFASDTKSMQIWATSSNPAEKQSVRYINGLDHAVSENFLEFDRIAAAFIESVVSRLNQTGVHGTSLAHLWEEVQEERSDPYSTMYRRREAELGFEPDECPEDIVEEALTLAQQMGDEMLSELAPTCGKESSETKPFITIKELIESSGLKGKPVNWSNLPVNQESMKAPWQQAKEVASFVRKEIGNEENPLTNKILCDLLGLQESEYDAWHPPEQQSISVSVPSKTDGFYYHPRRRHPLAKRFEFARLVGDYLFYGNLGNSWLASTDIRTSRQQYQRAFAAEFLCPLDNLQEYLNNDYSESAIEDASEYFKVSKQTIEMILVNNRLIASSHRVNDLDSCLPYYLDYQ